jgi:hypothetical protein
MSPSGLEHAHEKEAADAFCDSSNKADRQKTGRQKRKPAKKADCQKGRRQKRKPAKKAGCQKRKPAKKEAAVIKRQPPEKDTEVNSNKQQ